MNPSHKFEHNIDLLVKTTFITYLLWNNVGFFQPMHGKSSFSEFGLISNNLDKPHIKFNLSLRKSLTIPLHKSKVHYASRQDQDIPYLKEFLGLLLGQHTTCVEGIQGP